MITRLEADKAMLQEQIKNLFKQNQRNQEDVEELEQYGRGLPSDRWSPHRRKRNKQRCSTIGNAIMQ